MKTSLPAQYNKIPFFKNPITRGLITALFLLLTVASPALAINTQKISAYPTHSSDTDPRTKSWFIYSLPAGETKSDSVTIVNNSSSPLTLKVYPADSITASDGSFALANENAQKKDVGSWITMATSQVTLGPGEQKQIPFTITIPANIAKGDHAGGIIFQETAAQKVNNINIVTRVGVRIYETVPGDEQLSMMLRNVQYSVTDNLLTFSFTAENNGTVHIAPRGMLEVKDMFGRTVDRIRLDSMLGVVVPGKPQTFTVPTKILAPVLGWDSVNIALYYSPTKAAVAGMMIMPNPWGVFLLVFIVLLTIAVVIGKKFLVRKKRKSGKTTLAPHIRLIAGGILLGIIGFSFLVSVIFLRLLHIR